MAASWFVWLVAAAAEAEEVAVAAEVAAEVVAEVAAAFAAEAVEADAEACAPVRLAHPPPNLWIWVVAWMYWLQTLC